MIRITLACALLVFAIVAHVFGVTGQLRKLANLLDRRPDLSSRVDWLGKYVWDQELKNAYRAEFGHAPSLWSDLFYSLIGLTALIAGVWLLIK